MMDWTRLLDPARFLGPGVAPLSEARSEQRSPFLKDLDRITYSSAFRRLQGKTQVHPFPETDYLRTRLTHSVEVSSVARTLGQLVGRTVAARLPAPDGQRIEARDLADLVAAAGLAHDIGHPPFAHAGEEAIRHWFGHDRPDLLAAGLGAPERADLEGFEANAQGFRILTRLQYWRERGGMRLCLGTLGTFSKYPRASLAEGAGADAAAAAPAPPETTGARRKFGYFQADRDAFALVATRLGLEPVAGQRGAFARHPLAYLVEAADDICYLTIDLEDGFKSGWMAFAEVEELLQGLSGRDAGEAYGELDQPGDRVAFLRSKAIGSLIRHAAAQFLDHEEELLAGRFQGTLLDRAPERELVAEVRRVSSRRLYNDERKLQAELAGFAVVRGLLDLYAEALLAWERAGHELDRLPPLHRKTLRLVPGHERLPHDRYQALLWLTDYVSGMTNRYALTQYRTLRGTPPGLALGQ